MDTKRSPAEIIKKHVRFPDDGEISDFLEEAVPLAEQNAAKHHMEVETWMVADAMARICPELAMCDHVKLEAAIECVMRSQNRDRKEEGSV